MRPRKLATDPAIILRWMLDGCAMWQRDRLGTAAAVQRATDSYFEGQDGFRHWLDERCILDPSLSERPSSLLSDFQA